MIKRFGRRQFGVIAIVLALIPHVGIVARADSTENACLSAQATGCTNGLPTFQYQLLLGEMAAHPAPDVRPLAPDISEIGVSPYYRVFGGIQPVYNAPNGNVVGVVDSGFNFVALKSRQGDW